jgi:hypothetical protein
VADPIECRKHASSCLRRAQIARTSELRAKLLSLAEAWVNLATEAEQYEALRLNEWERKMPHYP